MAEQGELEIKTDTGPFLIVPEWVIDTRLSAQAFRLYALLAVYADWKDGSSWPSRATLAKRLNTSTDSIDRWLRELTEQGCVTVVKRTDPANPARNLSNLYYLHRLPPSHKPTATPTRKSTATPTRKDTALTRPNLEHDPLDRDIVKLVFTTWLDSTGKDATRTKLDNIRLARIRWALGNYPQEDVLDAVRGWEYSDFHTGANSQRKTYNDLTLLLRNSEKLEYFRDLYRDRKPLHPEEPMPEKPTREWQPCGNCKNGWIEITDEKGYEYLAPCPCRAKP